MRELLMHNQYIPFHDIGYMVDQMVVDFYVQLFWLVDNLLLLQGADFEVVVVVLGAVELAVPDVKVCAWVAGVGDVARV